MYSCLQSSLQEFTFGYSLTAFTKMKAEWQRWLILTRDAAALQRTIRRKNSIRESEQRFDLVFIVHTVNLKWHFPLKAASTLPPTQNWQQGIIYPQEKCQAQHFKMKFSVLSVSNNNCASHLSVLPFSVAHTIYLDLYLT